MDVDRAGPVCLANFEEGPCLAVDVLPLISYYFILLIWNNNSITIKTQQI